MLGMISCKEATLLVQKNEDRKLSWGERMKLRVHMMLCSVCALFQQQSKYIGRHARNMEDNYTPDNKLSTSSKSSIKEQLNNIRKV